MSKYRQGFFKPLNPKKYKGNVKQIVYRSSWELKLLIKLDKHPDVIEYSSEEIIVPYKSPLDNKYHRYFIDFYVKLRDSKGDIQNLLIEVKPKHQTMQPVRKPRQQERTFLRECATYAVNQAKWEAAEKYAHNRGWEFKIFTEDHLDI